MSINALERYKEIKRMEKNKMKWVRDSEDPYFKIQALQEMTHLDRLGWERHWLRLCIHLLKGSCVPGNDPTSANGKNHAIYLPERGFSFIQKTFINPNCMKTNRKITYKRVRSCQLSGHGPGSSISQVQESSWWQEDSRLAHITWLYNLLLIKSHCLCVGALMPTSAMGENMHSFLKLWWFVTQFSFNENCHLKVLYKTALWGRQGCSLRLQHLEAVVSFCFLSAPSPYPYPCLGTRKIR